MRKNNQKRGKNSKKRSFYYIGFALLFSFWVSMSALCYTGIIAFDPKTVDGALVLGLGLTGSVYGGFEFLKKVYDDGVSTFKKKRFSIIYKCNYLFRAKLNNYRLHW
jgi:hypothetical protein